MTTHPHDHTHEGVHAQPAQLPAPEPPRRVTATNFGDEEIELFDNAVGWSWGPSALLITLSDRRTVCVPLEQYQTITIWPI